MWCLTCCITLCVLWQNTTTVLWFDIWFIRFCFAWPTSLLCLKAFLSHCITASCVMWARWPLHTDLWYYDCSMSVILSMTPNKEMHLYLYTSYDYNLTTLVFTKNNLSCGCNIPVHATHTDMDIQYTFLLMLCPVTLKTWQRLQSIVVHVQINKKVSDLSIKHLFYKHTVLSAASGSLPAQHKLIINWMAR